MAQESIQFETVSDKEFEKYPDKPPAKPDRWDPVMEQIEQGKIVRLAYESDKERRGYQLVLGRKAAKREFRVETRYQDGTLVARKSDIPYVPKEARSSDTPVTVGPDPAVALEEVR